MGKSLQFFEMKNFVVSLPHNETCYLWKIGFRELLLEQKQTKLKGVPEDWRINVSKFWRNLKLAKVISHSLNVDKTSLDMGI